MSKKIRLILCIIDVTSFNTNLSNPNIDILDKYFILEFWDLRGLNNTWRKKKPGFRFEDESNYSIRYFDSFADFRSVVKSLKSSVDPSAFLFTGSVPFWIKKALRFIEKHEMPYFIKRNTSGYTEAELAKSLLKKNIKSLKSKVINYFYSKIVRSRIFFAGLKGPTVFFAGIRKELDFMSLPIKDENIIFTHNKDYDTYLRTLDEPSILDEEYFVFVDQNFPFHRETSQLKLDPELFYSRILSFLESIAKIAGKNYVIALHPTSDINLLSQYLPKEKLFIGKTVPLIRRAEFCITINSSIALASVITGAPLILLSYEGLLPSSFESYTLKLESIFNIKALKYNEPVTKESINKILDLSKRETKALFENYIKHPGTEEKLEYEIIAENIIKHFDKAVHDYQ